jgi:hypothetical protein
MYDLVSMQLRLTQIVNHAQSSPSHPTVTFVRKLLTLPLALTYLTDNELLISALVIFARIS